MSLEKDDSKIKKSRARVSSTKNTKRNTHAISTVKKDDVIQEEVSSKIVEKSSRHSVYVGYVPRLLFKFILFVVFLLLGTFLLISSFTFKSEKIIKYKDNSDIDYKVYLLDNDFYDTDYLEKDDGNKLFVASLIKNIGIDFKYDFSSEEAADIDFAYNVIGKLVITDSAGTRSYFEKNYTLLEDKVVNMRNGKSADIRDSLVVDYQYYNRLASSFKSSYGVDAVSKLVVYISINKKNADNKFNLNNNRIMKLEIPLSEKAVEIGLDYKKINDTSEVVEKQDVFLKSVLVLIISIILIVLSLIIMIRLMRSISLLFTKKNQYDKYIKKILREYDRLIAESNSMISLEGKEIIRINKFQELLDIHDNLGLPIVYYEVAKHQKCYFYICHNDIVYINTVKDVDLEKKLK